MSSLLSVSDNEKRWLVFGIVLNKVLISKIRPFVEQHVQTEYVNLKTSHGIDTQSATGRLQHWPNLGPARQILLKYENINGNDGLPRVRGRYNYSVFNCRVTSHVDFSKLYLENFMAKFNAFDEHCDASAVLNLLGKVPVFSAAVQNAASDVRQARNAWAHCTFGDWAPVKFQQCFNEMEQLVKVLGLPAAVEGDLLTDIKDWETKGTILCMNASVDPDLLKLVHRHVNTLTKDVEMLAFEVKEDRDKVLKALRSISTKLEELEKRLVSVECEQEVIKQEQVTLHANWETTQENLKRLELKQEENMQENLKSLKDVQQRVAHVEDQQSSAIVTRKNQGASDVNAGCLQNEHVQQHLTQVEAEKHSSATPQITCEIANCETDINFFAARHDEDTRQWLFDDFDKWFSDPGNSRAYVLLGDAGIGKSVMAGALARRSRKAGHLGAAFFCRHYDGTRNNPRYLLGTIARQICDCNSQYSNIVGGEGGVSMMLTNSKLGVHELFTKLLEEPLHKCDPYQQRKLVIIDALDETEYESREEFLDLVKERFYRLPKWLVFFITSRPEDTIQSRLERYNPCVRICAGNSEQRSLYQQHEQDIQRFLEKEVDFSRLPYPLEEVTKKCNGLFLYAFYIANVLKDSVHSGKIDQFSQLSEFFPGDMEDFFRVNFQRVFRKVGADFYKKFFGCVITAPAPLPVSFISFVLNRENSDLEEQDVIDAVSLFVVLQTSDQTVSFLHNLIPAWLTNKKKARKLFIDKKIAGEYLKTIFIQILSDVVEEPMETSIDADLQSFVLHVAVRFLCQHGDKDSLKVIFSCLTSYRFLEKRIQSGRIEVYHLLEDLKLVADCFTVEETQKQNILQEISLALETDVHVLLECPHLLRSCIRNASNFLQNSILVPHVSVPWMEWHICNISAVELVSSFDCFATASDRKTVAAAKGLSLFLVDSSTLKTVSGPFEISQDTIKKIRHLQFSTDDKFVFFGRLDKWFSVERGCVEDLPQFIDSSIVYEWGLLTSDGQAIVVENNCLFDFPLSCRKRFCVTELLALWATKEIDESQDDQKTCSFRWLGGMRAGISAMGRQMARLIEFLQINPRLCETRVTFVPDDPICYYCYRLKELTKSNQKSSLATVRQLIIELYPRIFRHQVWNLQTGRPLLYDIFYLDAQFNSFTYFCHVTSAFENWEIRMECSGVDKTLSVCNIAVVNAIYAFLKVVSKWDLEELLERQQIQEQARVLKLRRIQVEKQKARLKEIQEQELELKLKQIQEHEWEWEWVQAQVRAQGPARAQERQQMQEQVEKQKARLNMELRLKEIQEQEQELELKLKQIQKGKRVRKWVRKRVRKRVWGLELEQKLKQIQEQERVRKLAWELVQEQERLRKLSWELVQVQERELEQEWEWEWEWEQEQEQEREQEWKWERNLALLVDLELFCDSFKSSLFINFPKGFLDLVGTGISLCVSPEKKWVAVRKNFQEINLLQTGIQEQDFFNDNSGKQEPGTIADVLDFTFTTDDLYVVYLSYEGSLHAMSLQTGTSFKSVSGLDLFYFLKENQTGYLFRSGAEERAIFLTNLHSHFKWFPVTPMTSGMGKSIATIFISSNTVASVSSYLHVTLWNTRNEERGTTFKFISRSSLAASRSLEKCVPSPNGKHVAIQQRTKIDLYSVTQPERFHCTVFERDFCFTDVCLTFSSDGTLLLFCIQDNFSEPHFYVWDVQKKALSVSFKSPGLLTVDCFCLSSDKINLILCGEYEIEVWEFDELPGRSLNRIGVERTYKSVKFSQCAVSLDNELLVCCMANLIFLYNLRVAGVRSSKRVLRGHLGKIEFCKFLKVNRYLISYAVDGIVFLWDIIKSKAAGFARITQGQESIVSMAVSSEEDRVICFLSSDRVSVINLCNLECTPALSSKFWTAPARGKVDTSADTRRLQPAGQIASTSEVPFSSVEDEAFSSSDSDEDMAYYYQEHEELEESD